MDFRGDETGPCPEELTIQEHRYYSGRTEVGAEEEWVIIEGFEGKVTELGLNPGAERKLMNRI